jgi:hypothetical protein
MKKDWPGGAINENNGKRKKGCSHLFCGSHHQPPFNCPGSGILRASRRLKECEAWAFIKSKVRSIKKIKMR